MQPRVTLEPRLGGHAARAGRGAASFRTRLGGRTDPGRQQIAPRLWERRRLLVFTSSHSVLFSVCEL